VPLACFVLFLPILQRQGSTGDEPGRGSVVLPQLEAQAVGVDDSKANATNDSSAIAVGDCTAKAQNGEDVIC
jgi:hypothetical protein